MKVKSIAIYSESGEKREINFKLDGLNIITGRRSTGKSAISCIIEYCMGRSEFLIPEGVIRDSVVWYATIFQFAKVQVFVARPAPKDGALSCATGMIQVAASIEMPELSELKANCDTEAIVSTISEQIGIPPVHTVVPTFNSRPQIEVNAKHLCYYIFQKQQLISNNEQLFYRQNEDFIPQTIRDTLPVFLGVNSDEQMLLEDKLRTLKRRLKIVNKQIADQIEIKSSFEENGLSLIAEAKEVGLLPITNTAIDAREIESTLRIALSWVPTEGLQENSGQIGEIEGILKELHETKKELEGRLSSAKTFAKESSGFGSEIVEQIDRLKSIRLFPRNPKTEEWQWPFAPENLSLESPLAELLLEEVRILDAQLSDVNGEKPRIDKYISEIQNDLIEIRQRIRQSEKELASIIAANEAIAEMKSRENGAIKTLGRISYFIETASKDVSTTIMEKEKHELESAIANLEGSIGANAREEKKASALSYIGATIGRYVQALGAEFAEFPFRLDLTNLTVAIDRPERPVYMSRTGGGANHLAYHISALLAIHLYAHKNSRPFPRFIILDQPSQVYFPSAEIYKAVDGTKEKTRADVDMVEVVRFFQFLKRYTEEEVPEFQIIITEHANLDEDWYQKALVEEPWTNPPALVPLGWIS